MRNKFIDTFVKNNEGVQHRIQTNFHILTKLWNDDSFRIEIPTNAGLTSLQDIVLPVELVAIHHTRKNLLEFIFLPLKNDDKIKEREFQFNYTGETYKCFFDQPTEIFELFAKGFRENEKDSTTNYRNLRPFRDYFIREKLPEVISDYFKDRIPINFFIEGNLSIFKGDFVYFLKALNFYMSYYDRKSPHLVLLTKDISESDSYKVPCFSDLNEFPSSINAQKVEPTILDTLLIARETNDPRLKFIFYYQVLEYISYYYLESETDSKLKFLLKMPDVGSNTSFYAKQICEILKDGLIKNKEDLKKIEKLITEKCNLNDIKQELKTNSKYFTKNLKFEGDFELPKLFENEDAIDTLSDSSLRIIIQNIEKIRNVLVHLRESRENKVILPTSSNNNLLLPYLYILRRISEKLAILFN